MKLLAETRGMNWNGKNEKCKSLKSFLEQTKTSNPSLRLQITHDARQSQIRCTNIAQLADLTEFDHSEHFKVTNSFFPLSPRIQMRFIDECRSNFARSSWDNDDNNLSSVEWILFYKITRFREVERNLIKTLVTRWLIVDWTDNFWAGNDQ